MHFKENISKSSLLLWCSTLLCAFQRSPKSQLFSRPTASGNKWIESQSKFIEKQSNRDALHIRMSKTAASSENLNVTAPMKGRTCEQNALTANLKSLGKSRDWKNAYMLFKAEEVKDTVLFNAILSVARHCGRFSEAEAIFLEMRNQRVQLSPVTYNIMIDIFGKWKRIDSALRLWSDYKLSGCFPTDPDNIMIAYTALGNAAAKAGNLSMSLAVLEEVKQSGVVMPTRVLYGTALDACKVSGDHQTAQQLLEQIRSNGIKTDTVMYAAAIAAHRGTSMEILNSLLSDMEAEGVPTNKYVVDAYVLALLGTSPKGKHKLNVQIKKQFDALDPVRAEAISSALFEAQEKGLGFTPNMELVMDKIFGA